MDQLPPELGARPDPEKVFEWVKSHGIVPVDAGNHAKANLPVSHKAVEGVGRMLNWLALTVLLVSLAMGSIALWLLRSVARY